MDSFCCLPFLSFLSPIQFSFIFFRPTADRLEHLLIKSPVDKHLLSESPSDKLSKLSVFIPTNETVEFDTNRQPNRGSAGLDSLLNRPHTFQDLVPTP